MADRISPARSRLGVVAWLLTAASLAACAGPTYIVQQYAGAVRPSETIAIVRVNGKDPIRLEVLDGEPMATRLAEDARLHVEVLPGRHTLSVRDLVREGALPGRASFVAAAGKIYRPVVSAPGASAWADDLTSTVRVFEVDSNSDAPVRDVTEAPARDSTN